ncbi:MAG TPA: hypothetical protein VHH09_01510 [Acidimicrobiales bacterium]|nr:hypothetical protein [Acidimicrobiales bacterium]
MTLLVLVVLAIIWVAVLVPPALRARAEGRPGDSISAFRRQLVVLRRTGPHAARSAAPDRARPHTYGPLSTAPVGSVTSLAARRAQAARRPAGAPARAMAPAAVSAARGRTLRRRRDVFTALVGAAAVTLLLGVIPAFRVLLLVHLAVDVLLGAYVALLIRQRSIAAERELKVRFLPESRPVQPALLRRSVN